MSLGIRILLLASLTFSAGCLYSMYGYNHVITYAAVTDEARTALVKRVEDDNALRDLVGVGFHKKGSAVFVVLSCSTKSMTGGRELQELRQKLEAALGPELVKQLRISKDWWPIP